MSGEGSVTQAGVLTVRLLGAPHVVVDDAAMEVDTRKATALLAYLAVTGGRHRRDALASLLWPNHDNERARGALRRTLSALRGGLGGRWVEADREAIWLDSAGVAVDVAQFRDLVAETGHHRHGPAEVCARCAEPLNRAVALHRDRFLAGFSLRDSVEFDDWQEREADVLETEVLAALGRLADAEAVGGDLAAAVAAARRRLAHDPLQEPAHRQLMRMHALAGDRSAAVNQYRECVRVLGRDLGVTPLPETRELYAQIKEGSVAPPETAAVEHDGEPAHDRGAGPAPGGPALRREAGSVPIRSPRPAQPPMVGRDQELGRLRSELDACATAGRFVGVEGEAGVGKSRLVDEAVDEAIQAGSVVVAVRCQEGEAGLAYGPVVAAIRAALDRPGASERLAGLAASTRAEAARLIAEVADGDSDAAPGSSQDPGAQLRFFEALHALVVCLCEGPAPGILLVEDVHHADPGTVALAAFIARRLSAHPLLLLATWRSGDGGSDHELCRLASGSERSGRGGLVRLGRLDADTVGELARWARDQGMAVDDAAAQALWEETEGLPFLCREYLQALGERGGGELGALPAARALLGARVEHLGEMAIEMAGAGAVLGRRFDFDRARQVSGRDEAAALEGIEELLARAILAEQGPGDAALAFTHEMLRALVLERLSLVRQRILHGRAADAIARDADREEGLAATVARHAEEAGRAELAAHWHERAGRRAVELLAHADALEHLRRAQALGSAGDLPLDEAIGDIQVLQGAYGDAIDAYETAAAGAEGTALAGIERKLAELHLRRGDPELAAAHLEAALAEADPQTAEPLTEIELVAARNEAERGRPGEARRFADSALARAEVAGDDELIARAHNTVGMLARGAGDSGQAIDHLEQAAAIAARAHSPGAEVAALNNLARVRSESGDPEAAVELAERALALAQRLRDRHHEAALHNNLADALHAAGQEDRAMDHLKHAVALFAEVGQADGLEPGVWKLSAW